MEKNFISIHTIVCPECKHKQTGIVKESPGLFFENPGIAYSINPDLIGHTLEIPFGSAYIRCSYIPCQHIIMNDELAEVTMQRVQFPNQINK